VAMAGIIVVSIQQQTAVVVVVVVAQVCALGVFTREQ